MGCSGSKEGAVLMSREGGVSTKAPPKKSAKDIVSQIPKGPKTGDSIKVQAGMFVTKSQTLMSDRYIKLKALGEGVSGQVWHCRDKISGADRAIKLIAKQGNQKEMDEFRNEVEVVKSLDHPNIMKIFEFFEDKKFFYLVMELYSGGELFEEIIKRQQFSETDACQVMEQCLSGICYLHSVNVIHRDLKPENLLLSSERADATIKIVDFGMATIRKREKETAKVGTAYYIAPEVINGSYDEKCDVWSLGVIMYILLTGVPPFYGDTDEEIINQIKNSSKLEFEAEQMQTTSKEALDLIRRMMVWDPKKRYSATQCLNHPWIKSGSHIGVLHKHDRGAATALANMRKFHSNQKLAQAAMLFMGSKLTTMEETKELTKVFKKIDRDGNGKLDRAELIEGYSLFARGGNLTKADIEASVDEILHAIDFDKNGFIEFSEFVTVAMNRTDLLTEERLRAAFALFDQDDSGAIAAEELRVLLGDIDDAVWKEILSEVDENGDGEVDFEEFEKMMLKLIEKAHA